MPNGEIRWRKHERIAYRSHDYRTFIRDHNCCVCNRHPTDPHHTENAGIGLKGSDFRCVPLCRMCHNLVHTLGRKTFQRDNGIDFELVVIALLEKYLERA